MSDISFTPPRKIAVFETFRESFRVAWSPVAIRMPMLWLPIALQVALSWMMYSLIGTGQDPQKLVERMQRVSTPQVIALVLVFILYMGVSMALMISWMRYLLRGETPTGVYFGPGFWRYLGYGMLIEIIFLGAYLAIGIPVVILLTSAHTLLPGFVIVLTALIIGLAAFASAIWAATSLIPFFIGLAIEDDGMTWKRSFQAMRGNIWRYLGANLLLLSPLFLAQMFLGLLQDGLPDNAVSQIIVHGLMLALVNVFQFILMASFMALIYRQLVPGQPARRIVDV